MPAATARWPAAVRIEVSICTVVVLPLVPVTHSQGAALAGSRRRQASSISLQIGTSRSAAGASNGACGGMPGEVTTTSTSAGSSAVLPGPRLIVAPRVSRICAFSRSASVSRSSSTMTYSAPAWSNESAQA